MVVFRDHAARANQVLPFSQFDSEDAEDLWRSMAGYAQRTGGQILAIRHNGNLSNGLMSAVEKCNGHPLDRDYAERRRRWEPLAEITQTKGDSEAHPFLPPGARSRPLNAGTRATSPASRRRPGICCPTSMCARRSSLA